MMAARDAWPEKIADVPPEKLVYIDETHTNTTMTRTHGRCPEGERLIAPIPHGHYKSLALLCALRTSGMCADRVLDEPLRMVSFVQWVRDRLLPTLTAGDVVVMDNLAVHKCLQARELIESVGARVQFLPPYSPDLNPIERAFGRLKGLLRKAGERTVAGLKGLLERLPGTFEPEMCESYIMGCI